ncbi:MAG: hypothetical protein PHE21_00740 [Candidatus Dojkabacteria bacterium]|nr:hypothetical protein [Candidatus Dojkabacteria bacterium]
MRKEIKKYEGQALAIAMVVLVVSAIIGISIYSRTLKDKMLTMGERASAEALEVSDLIIDHITKVSLDEIIEYLDTTHPYDDGDDPDIPGGDINYDVGVTLEESGGEISSLISTLAGATDVFSGLNFCELDSGNGNEYYLNIKRADSNTYFEIRAGQVMGIPIKGEYLAEPESVCSGIIKVAVRGDSTAGFSLLKTYGRNYTDGYAAQYKIYETDDEQQYCFSSSTTLGDRLSGDCNNSDFQGDSWLKFKDNGQDSIPIDDLNDIVSQDGNDYMLDEVRLRAVGGTIGVSFTNTNCISDFEMMEITAAANCNGVYRGKTIMIPAKKWGSPLFDYIIFNGEGSL